MARFGDDEFYSEDDLVVLTDGVGFIRRTPGMFFKDGQPTQEGLINWVLVDVVFAGARDFQVKRFGDFAGVFAEIDWMVSELARFEDFFTRLVPAYDNRPPNSIRAESILMAVASGILVTGQGPRYSANLLEADVPKPLMDLSTRSFRSLIWRFDGQQMDLPNSVNTIS